MGWAHTKLGDAKTGIAELRQGLTALNELGAKAVVPSYQGLLAEIEAEAGDAEGALAHLDEA